MTADTEPYTRADLAALPYGPKRELIDGILVVGDGDGFTVEAVRAVRHGTRRYELLDGLLVISPAPDTTHRQVAARVMAAFRTRGLTATEAPLVVLGERTEAQPDVLVSARDGWPLLAVEVMSARTRSFDLHLKPEPYVAAGIAYWALDLDPPSLRRWD